MAQKVLMIAIAGVTCSGKTTLAQKLNKILPNSRVISQDDYFLDVNDSRHIWITELNHINFDILTSLDMKKMHEDLLTCIENKTLLQKTSNNKEFQSRETLELLNSEEYQKELQNRIIKENLEIILVEGFSILNYEPMLPLFQLKFFATLTKEECFRRRLQRVYDPPDCPGYFEKCVWLEYLKQKAQVQNEVENVSYFDENTNNPHELVIKEITLLL